MYDRHGKEGVGSCALSVRIQREDMDYLKQSAAKHCRTLADELRYIIREARANNANAE